MKLLSILSFLTLLTATQAQRDENTVVNTKLATNLMPTITGTAMDTSSVDGQASPTETSPGRKVAAAPAAAAVVVGVVGAIVL